MTPCTAACHVSVSITNTQNLCKLMSIKLMMPSNHLILCRPLLLLPSMIPSIRVLSNESILHIKGPDYWSFSFRISASNVYSGLISFSILAVEVTLKSLHQHHILKASIPPCSAVFPVMTSGKTIALTRWTFAGKQCLCFWICCLGSSRLFIQTVSTV